MQRVENAREIACGDLQRGHPTRLIAAASVLPSYSIGAGREEATVAGVQTVTKERLLAEADVASLHLVLLPARTCPLKVFIKEEATPGAASSFF
jgi:hypothetical protein